jgi:DNA-directed RNA polymerase subunit RPC12/RpoP
MEAWTEIRCPACIGLGWNSSRLLLKVYGHVKPDPKVKYQFKCHRCKSIIEWVQGLPVLVPVTLGVRNHHASHAAFE